MMIDLNPNNNDQVYRFDRNILGWVYNWWFVRDTV